MTDGKKFAELTEEERASLGAGAQAGEKRTVSGSLTKPDFTMRCEDCGAEFTIKSTYFDIDDETCPECGSGNLKELYVMFPQDGPGFQSNYSATDITRCITLDEERKLAN